MVEIKEKSLVVLQGTIVVMIISLITAYISSLFFMGESVNTENINASIEINYIKLIFPLLLSPILEELIFRKWIPNAFQDYIGIKGSIFFSNSLFAFFHFDLFFLPYLLNGLVYSYIYEKTNDIKIPIITHILYNLFVFLITFIWF